jgi:hypothetical protein
MKPQPHSEITEIIQASPDSRVWLAYIKQKYGQDYELSCPYGCPGDRLRCLTTWAVGKGYDGIKPLDLPRMDYLKSWSCFDSAEKPEWCGKSRPGRFMPTWLRRRMPVAVILSVRAERVRDISEEDAKAEGAKWYSGGAECGMGHIGSYRHGFQRLWDSINEKRGYGWSVNPWVWAIEFRRLV